ncbi:2-amino-4-hydroxy-6-hydroxymethyldihydropteridinediphosphokinase [Alteribacillus persepolensis]|uniref:2-amino-4-hydroxy-6-hydroxymethyldihydropteridine diphosphokinase n=1 Tax=Alteribacillus persepolensis TaxID=568899 RepID=A0A1G8I1U5_9BACI|nr:2-amino-4-hydroxy-6-hydroxymethyldihydropteridine diphosphokinase [Alteribacillus persepolensis]SDI12863.1 2-amino-4-hydroxy-6-hydroxymethyldihydropteridinediphosphokinase [Alteribacillus persepolensis]
MNNCVYLALGSNMGDRAHYLKQAVHQLHEQTSIQVTKLSSIYETAPVGVTEQPSFLNMAAALKTSLSPEQLLLTTQWIERELDRVRIKRWGPRTIDLDILLFNDENIRMDDLYIPHPRMAERAFVLIPLNEIAEGVKEPITHRSIHDLVQDLSNKEKEGVRLWRKCSGPAGFELFES